MRVQFDAQPLLKLLERAQQMHVLVSPLAGEEALVSGLALKSMFESSGKKVDVIYPALFGEQIKTLPGGDQIKKNLPPRDLVISFDVSDNPIEKVSYYLEDKTFNLLIRPQRGRLEAKRVQFSNESFRSDLVLVLGSRRLSDLGSLYEENSLDFSKISVVNIDYHRDNEQFGQVNIVDEGALGVSEIIFASLGVWGLRPNYSAAECLLFGLGLLRDLKDTKKQKGGVYKQESSVQQSIPSDLEPSDDSYLGPPKIYTGTGTAS